MELEILSATIESILFVAEKPVSIERLKEVFTEEERPSDEAINEAVAAIQQRYQESAHGFELRQAQGGYHFVTKMENAEYVRRFQASKPFRLGRSALEVLAIVAYRQPITRAEIDQVRGIDSSHLMRTLMERGLVKMGGKAEVPGRPVQYATTPRFLEVVGLTSVGELPPLSELEQLQGNTEDPIKKLEENLDRVMAVSRAENEAAPDDEAGLIEIDTLIQSAHEVKEVFASADHAEVAKENEAALSAFQTASRQHRRARGTVRYEDLTAVSAVEVEPEAEPEPEPEPDLVVSSESDETPSTSH
jgi:segregation and condensation protein B